ncbi:hypothetical protein TIFTF001_009798 [Ficus carica]|uniref:Uncharacterized protein n=1 Tax=Ficus carica TaxID=3494 RepID=A0AA87ZX22_FICCA|nr:hypothetical protein TIFTF001_009798 [Ficus carica]
MVKFVAAWFAYKESENAAEDINSGRESSLSRASLKSINDEFSEEECDRQNKICVIWVVKYALGFVDNTDKEKNVLVTTDFNNDDESTGYGHEATLEIVPISFIEQSLCLVDQSPAKDNF